MNKLILLAGLCLGTTLSAPAGLFEFASIYTTGFQNSGNILDGNISPWSDTRTVSGITEPSIQSVSVRLQISGGFNGDLYGYLSYNGALVPLLNRAGVGTGNAFGYSDGGLNVKLTDIAGDNIHSYQTISGYSISDGTLWKPDGRTINPVTSQPSDFNAAGTVTFCAFSGMSPNGEWTLVLADVSKGGGQAQIMSWGLDITAVPEPVNVALGIFAGLGLAVQAGRAWRRRRGKA